MLLSALLGSEAVFEPGNTILVLDEIQECPDARTALKFFHLDGRYDVIGTGSLLGVRGYGTEPKSIPVGYETAIDMSPLGFEEFLWATIMLARAVKFLLFRSTWHFFLQKYRGLRKLLSLIFGYFCDLYCIFQSFKYNKSVIYNTKLPIKV